jgi:iron(III) transport system ATP-binding protein
MGIRVKNLSKTYRSSTESVAALGDVSLDVEDGEFFVLLGPSGSGKTTLLRCVAGLEQPDGGEIYLDSTCVYSQAEMVYVPAESRRLGMVFQSYAIWPHLTVYENVALPLQHGKAKIAKGQVKERVQEALSLVGMADLGSRGAPQLSGGQQQRVALARALALKPSRLLMDEPLSNLDARLREEVRGEMKSLIKGAGVTVLYVTHDQDEAMDLADRIAVMHQGNILQVGSAEDLYSSPIDVNVANFLGTMNWLAGTVGDDGAVTTDIGQIQTADRDHTSGAKVTVGVRPEDVTLTGDAEKGDSALNVFVGEITSNVFLGDYRVYEVAVGKQVLTVRAPVAQQYEGRVGVRITEENVCMFDESERT